MEFLCPATVFVIWLIWFLNRSAKLDRADQAVVSLADRLTTWLGPEFPRSWFLLSRDSSRAVCVAKGLNEFVVYTGSCSSMRRFPASHLRRAELVANDATTVAGVGLDLGLGIGVGSAALVKKVKSLRVRLHLQDAANPFFDVCVFETDVPISTSTPQWRDIEQRMAAHLSRLEMVLEQGAAHRSGAGRE